MEDILKQILGKLNDMEQRFDKIDERFNQMDQRFDRIEADAQTLRQEAKERFDKLENVIRMSSQDIVDSQVEYVEKFDIQDKKMDLFGAQLTHLTGRVSRLEKVKKINEK